MNNPNKFSEIRSDLTLWAVYKDGTRRTYYGRELRNTVRQIRYMKQKPLLNYDQAFEELETLARQLGPQTQRIVIYFTTEYARNNGDNGYKLREWVNGNLVFAGKVNFETKLAEYIDSKTSYLQDVIMKASVIVNYFNRKEVIQLA